MLTRTFATAAAMAMSSFVWLMGLALMPAPVGFLALVVMAGTLIALSWGVGERAAVAVLTGSRPITVAEQAELAPMLVQLSAVGANPGELLVRRRVNSSTPAVQLLGRASTIISPVLVNALVQRQIHESEAATLVLHASGAHRVRHARTELAYLVLTIPWRALVGVGPGVARGFAWLPMTDTAWRLRGVLAVVCVIQGLLEGPLWPGLLGAALVVASYVVPAGLRSRLAAEEAAGDHLVVEADLGPVLLGLLLRQRFPVSLERRQRLGVIPRPRLQLVR